MYQINNKKIIKAFSIEESEHIIVVHEMEKEDITEWIEKHQPISIKMGATDGKWLWRGIYSLSKICDLLNQKIERLVYRVNGEIIGMSIMAYNYPCVLNPKSDPKNIKSYLWYMVKSQKANGMLKSINIDPNNVKFQKYVYAIMFERGEEYSSFSDAKSLWLHADRQGGDRLLDMYRNFGFDSCPIVQDKILKYRKDDERYFYLNEEKLKGFSSPTQG